MAASPQPNSDSHTSKRTIFSSISNTETRQPGSHASTFQMSPFPLWPTLGFLLTVVNYPVFAYLVHPTLIYFAIPSQPSPLVLTPHPRTDNHDIVSISSKNLYSTKSSRTANQGKPRPMGTPQKESGGWGWFFVKCIFAVMVLGGGYVGWVAYRANKRSSRF